MGEMAMFIAKLVVYVTFATFVGIEISRWLERHSDRTNNSNTKDGA